jgi:Rod binding domain-containing protein
LEIAKIGSIQPALVGAGGASPTTLREATQQFESLFISQLMKSMRATVPESHLMGSGEGQQLFREMLDQELAGRVAESGGIGIGEMLYRQLSPKQTSAVNQQIPSGRSGIAASPGNETRSRPTSESSRSHNHED